MFGVVTRYDLSKEFPICTLRPINWRKSLEEIIWIFSKKSNKLSDLDSKIWDNWGLEDGTIGKAYGYVLAEKHQYHEGVFDQVDKVLYDLKNNQQSRRIMTNFWSPQYTVEKALQECAYSLTFDVVDGKLNMMLNQRSGDLLTAAFPGSWNVVGYAFLQHMFAIASNLQVGELIHVIANAHLYDKHIPLVEELLTREEYPAPTLWIDPTITNFYDFKPEHFQLINYKAGEQIKNIPIAI